VGDTVLMRPSDSDKPPYVARIEKIDADHRNNVKVRVRWYYRPEESIGGRRQFHGAKELFLSDHYDVQSAHTIEGTCTVHTFKNYTKLENVGADDFFCRFEYKAATGGFTPDRVAVYVIFTNSSFFLSEQLSIILQNVDNVIYYYLNLNLNGLLLNDNSHALHI
jgi:BAH domain